MEVYLNIAIVIVAALALAGCGETENYLTMEKVEPKAYRVKTVGTDLRVYTWSDPSNEWRCMFVAGENKGGLTCRTQ